MTKDTLGIAGELRFYERPEWISLEEFSATTDSGHLALTVSNLATNGLFNYVLGNMGGITSDLTVRTLGLGFGSGIPAKTDLDLISPWMTGLVPVRYPVTLFTASPSTGGATFSFFIPSSDTPNQSFTEAGLFCGTAAGDVSFLATRSVFNYGKGPQTDLRIDYLISRS